MNMDYAVSEALKYNTDGIRRVILLYDIMCQYWKNLHRRFQSNPHLSYPEGMEILRGIGLFHVHGHKDECYARYAPTFIPGAGMVDGEVLETLWAVLNGIANSIRSQSTAHRRETLDDHMNDSNWKKLIQMSEYSGCIVLPSILMSDMQSVGSAKSCWRPSSQQETVRVILQHSMTLRTPP